MSSQTIDKDKKMSSQKQRLAVNKPSALAGIGAMDICEFAKWKPTDTGWVSVTIDGHRATSWRHFERLTNMLIQLKIWYAAPELRCYTTRSNQVC